jgi:hypothetical protein
MRITVGRCDVQREQPKLAAQTSIVIDGGHDSAQQVQSVASLDTEFARILERTLCGLRHGARRTDAIPHEMAQAAAVENAKNARDIRERTEARAPAQPVSDGTNMTLTIVFVGGAPKPEISDTPSRDGDA